MSTTPANQAPGPFPYAFWPGTSRVRDATCGSQFRDRAVLDDAGRGQRPRHTRGRNSACGWSIRFSTRRKAALTAWSTVAAASTRSVTADEPAWPVLLSEVERFLLG